MDERKTTIAATRNGEPSELWIRYTLPAPTIASSEVEVIDLEIQITLAYGNPSQKILDGRFGQALAAGEPWSTEHNDSATRYRWEVSAAAMRSLRRFLISQGAIEGELDTPPAGPRSRLSILAG